MATSDVTYTFAAGTSAVASEVNTNFADLVSFLNGSVVHKDGSVSMTGQLTLVGAPVSANHAARKSYVDAAAGSMALISSHVISGGVNTITVSNIPAAYSHLLIHGSARSTSVADNIDALLLQFNGDTGNTYNRSQISVTSNTLGGSSTAAQPYFDFAQVTAAPAVANRFSRFSILIPHYAKTNRHKQFEASSSRFTGEVSTTFQRASTDGLWESTAAISALTLFLAVGNFHADSEFSLYGLS